MHGRIEDGALVSDDLPPLSFPPAIGFESRGSCELESAGVALAARRRSPGILDRAVTAFSVEALAPPRV